MVPELQLLSLARDDQHAPAQAAPHAQMLPHGPIPAGGLPVAAAGSESGPGPVLLAGTTAGCSINSRASGRSPGLPVAPAESRPDVDVTACSCACAAPSAPGDALAPTTLAAAMSPPPSHPIGPSSSPSQVTPMAAEATGTAERMTCASEAVSTYICACTRARPGKKIKNAGMIRARDRKS